MFSSIIKIDTSTLINALNDVILEVRFANPSPQLEDQLCEKFKDDVTTVGRKLAINITSNGSETVMQIRVVNV